MRTLTLLILASTVMTPLAIRSANAAACTTGAGGDVSLIIGSTTYSSSKCADNVAQGGGPTTEAAAMDTGLGTSSILLASSDGTYTTDQGILFKVTATSGDSAGTWHVTWTDTNGPLLLNLPISLNLEVGQFGGNNGSAYLLTNVLLPASPTFGNGTFDIDFTVGKGHEVETPDLSHLILSGSNFQEVSKVPEPMSMALLGAGLLGLGAVRHRRGNVSI